MRLLFILLLSALGVSLHAQCPIILSFTNQDLVGCEGDNFIFGIQFDDEDLATIEWTLPDGTISNEHSFGFGFEAPDGCNTVHTIAYKVTCENNTILEEGSLDVNVFTYNEAIVEIEDCTYTVVPDCPDDVTISGGNVAGGVHTVSPGEMGSVIFVINNPGSPEECDENSFTYGYNCHLLGLEQQLAEVRLQRVHNQVVLFNPEDPTKIQTLKIYNLIGQEVWAAENFLLNSGANALPPQLDNQPYIISGETAEGSWARRF